MSALGSSGSLVHKCENLVPILHIVHVKNHKSVKFEHKFYTPKIIAIDRT